MNRFKTAALCLLLASGCASGCGGSSATTPSENGVAEIPPGRGPESVFLSGARFIPGDGSPAIEKSTIIVYEGKIHDVGTDLKAPKGAELREGLDEYTIIPMMINLSSLPGLSSAGDFNAKNYTRDSLVGDLNRYLYYGVAAVVAGGDADGLAVQVRDEQKAGNATGAALHTSGRGIAAKGASGILGSVPILVGSEDEARKAVTELADRKSDVVVLWAGGMKGSTIAAVVDEAHKHKLKVFVDAPALSEAKEAVKAGADALIGSVRENDVDDELISLMKDKKVSLAPALSSLEARFIYIDKPRWRGEQVMLEVYPPAVSAYLGNEIFLSQLKRTSEAEGRRTFGTAKKNLKKMADGGVTIAFGSGSGSPWTLPGYFEHHELELMVEAGLSPADALKAASVSSAAALGAADMGSLARGKKANFTIVSGDPLKDITATKQIEEVWFNGKKEDRQDLTRKYAVRAKEITKVEIDNERKLREEEARLEADKKLTHYVNGKFVLGPPQNLPGVIVQTPKYSKSSKTEGPPHRVTISMPGFSAEDLKAFQGETSFRSWTATGGCWEKPIPGQSGKFRACAEGSSGQLTVTINVQ